MNPLNWSGPEFLELYVPLAAGGLLLLYLLFRFRKSDKVEKLLDDPYMAAYLRGGAKEAVRSAVVVLIERGVLAAEGTVRKLRSSASRARLQYPLEKALFRSCAVVSDVKYLENLPDVKSACDSYRDQLVLKELMYDSSAIATRWLLYVAVAVGISGLGLAKLLVAVSRGKSNVGILIMLLILFLGLVWRLRPQWRTFRGEAVLERHRARAEVLNFNSRDLFGPVRADELAWLVTGLGLWVLSNAMFPYVRQLYPEPVNKLMNLANWDSGSSGGGCGGGGCGGGGCGGCGGN